MLLVLGPGEAPGGSKGDVIAPREEELALESWLPDESACSMQEKPAGMKEQIAGKGGMLPY